MARVATVAALWPIPDRMRGWNWQGLVALPGVDTRATEAALDWWMNARGFHDTDDGSTTGLYLCGDFGRCKTGIGVSLLRDAMLAYGRPAAYVRTVKLFEAMRATNRGDGAEAQIARQRVEGARTVDVLLLDDLAAERPTGYVLEQLAAFIEDRRERGDAVRTIITCNLALDDLADALLEAPGLSTLDQYNIGRIIERIAESYTEIAVEGNNQRPNWRRGTRGEEGSSRGR